MACTSHDCGFVDFGDANFGGLLDHRGSLAVWTRQGEAMFSRWQDFASNVTGRTPEPDADPIATLTQVFELLTRPAALAA